MSSKSVNVDGRNRSLAVPRATIHKQILEAAETDPEATVEQLAASVSGASATLVERVLDEYGDPATDSESSGQSSDSMASADESQSEAEPESDIESETYLGPEVDEEAAAEKTGTNGSIPDSEPRDSPEESDVVPEYEELSDRQQEVIEAIYAHPDASQRDLASVLGISGATVSVHANSIPGFNWEERETTVTAMVENSNSRIGENTGIEEATETESGSDTQTETAPAGQTSPGARDEDDESTAELEARMDQLEQRLDSTDVPAISDPSLAHKVVHACMESDQITAEEELEVIATVLDK